MMKNSKNKRAIIMAVILLGLLIVAYKVAFVSPSESVSVPIGVNIPSMNTTNTISSSTLPIIISSSGDVESILKEMESINFDMNIVNDQKFKSLKSIEISIPSLPIGRKDPFSTIAGSKK